MTQPPSADRRFLALNFPFLPAERWRIHQRGLGVAPAETPLAFVEKVKGAIRLSALDARAHALGLVVGLTLADARARVPELEMRDLDPRADTAWLVRLADGCLRYTPRVAIDPPAGLVLDVSGCAHLFGGEAALAADLARRLAAIGMSARHALAASAEAARALAQAGGAVADEAAAVAALPVAALGLGDDRTIALMRAGLKTVGAVAARPPATIAARFGADAIDALAHLTGAREAPIAPHRAPPAIEVERRFAEPIARDDYALAVLRELAGEAAAELGRRHHGGRRFEALFFRSDGAVRRLGVATGQPTRDPAAIARLFDERIASLADPLDPGFGYDLIRLGVATTEPLAATQLALEGGEVAAGELGQLIDRLSIRLGPGRLRRFAPGDSHLPEQAELRLPAIEAAPPGGWDTPEPGEPPLRPIHLFDLPQRVEVIAEVPDGPPRRFRWRRDLYEVRRFEGPERIAARWWRRRDGGGLTRDYYRVEDARGRRFWLFRHGLYGEERADPRWYLHGLFA